MRTGVLVARPNNDVMAMIIMIRMGIAKFNLSNDGGRYSYEPTKQPPHFRTVRVAHGNFCHRN
jgi:hypothetical protein